MLKPMHVLLACLTVTTAGTALAGADAGSGQGDLEFERHTFVRLPGLEGTVRAFEREGRILSVYGRPMTRGASPEERLTAIRSKVGSASISRYSQLVSLSGSQTT